jgi:nucleotide-binding universal stress UspA family protein
MKNREKILLAVDGSKASGRAVQYVGKFASLMDSVEICILNVYPGPPPDYYSKGGLLNDYVAMREERAVQYFNAARTILIEAGVQEEQLNQVVRIADGRTISEEVLAVQAEGNYGTVVAGKRGVSKAEEFLFGSISNALARHSKHFTSWIVG